MEKDAGAKLISDALFQALKPSMEALQRKANETGKAQCVTVGMGRFRASPNPAHGRI